MKQFKKTSNKFSETDIIKMFVFLIENTCVLYGRVPFQQIGGIPMVIKCAPLIADLFLYSFHADHKQGLMRKCEKKLALYFYFSFHCLDDVSASLNNSEFGDFVYCIYTVERHIKDTADTLGPHHILIYT